MSVSLSVRSSLTGVANTMAILRRELAAFFFSPVAYVVMFLFVLSNGVAFYLYCAQFAGAPQHITYVVRSLFQFAFFWVLPLSPLLTMRLFSEEKRTGTLEMLMTAPVSPVQVVIGKFLAAQLFYMVVWSTLLLFVVVLEVLGQPEGPDWGPVMSMYFGLFFLGTLTNSLGVFASSFSRNQLVASILALTGNLLFFAVALGAWIYVDNPDFLRIFQFASFQAHFSSDYIRGVIQLRYLVFYLSFMAFFLFLAVGMVESRKWR